MLFTATRLQVATYLAGVCLFSIAILVYLNASVSFVITTLIKQRTDVGDAVGSLGFADELLAILACPAWGVVSDRLGVRIVSFLGFVLSGLALFLFPLAKNVFPQLLLARLLFSLGASAQSTMVTAILPAMMTTSGKHDEAKTAATERLGGEGHGIPPSICSDATITPRKDQDSHIQKTPSRLAGIVGLFTGCGALLALGFLLRLPDLLQRTGLGAQRALTASYYIVGLLALVLSLICYIGLRNLKSEDGKGYRLLLFGQPNDKSLDFSSMLSSLSSLFESFVLGFKVQSLGMAYLGGFVARSSSISISTFIPLYVNAYYLASGQCDEAGRNPQDVKEKCRGAYVLAAELTGISQLVALMFAPVFGYLADRYRRFNGPLIIAALTGLLGYIGLAKLRSPEVRGAMGSPWIIFVMALLGISQIGAIVCSLGLISHGVLGSDIPDSSTDSRSTEATMSIHCHGAIDENVDSQSDHTQGETNRVYSESAPLLSSATANSREKLRGSIAGIYSLFGGAGILILTKVGGLSFDKVSPVAPFYILAFANGVLLLVGLVLGISRYLKDRRALLTLAS